MVNLPQRKNIRLRNYDYSSNGFYFVTICSHQGKLHLLSYQNLITEVIHSLPTKFSGVDIDYYILMPDHLHIIFILNESKVTLGEVVRFFKASVTKRGKKKLWQRNYYEHIIRNEKTLNKIREYIKNNPLAKKIDFEEIYEKNGFNKLNPYKKM